MITKKSKNTKNFNGMSYRDIQRVNSKNRNKLPQKDKKWLKENGYKNIGWNNVIRLNQKINEFLDKSVIEDLSLEELFLEADRIGNKYLSHKEIEEFNQRLAKEINEIAEEIDRQFPDSMIEIIDFSEKANKTYRKKANKK